MSTSYEGGPAFPAPADIRHATTQGMTLRDYFAAAALQGIVAHPGEGMSEQNNAIAAYLQADAMLARRALGGAA